MVMQAEIGPVEALRMLTSTLGTLRDKKFPKISEDYFGKLCYLIQVVVKNGDSTQVTSLRSALDFILQEVTESSASGLYLGLAAHFYRLAIEEFNVNFSESYIFNDHDYKFVQRANLMIANVDDGSLHQMHRECLQELLNKSPADSAVSYCIRELITHLEQHLLIANEKKNLRNFLFTQNAAAA